ncbi:hypothetical protein CERSUDRAFT_161695 [Gelatoporia subvermispora B]|uniref:C2H2-type domain-containing protein n=1 Tax=Ceriporiopsis subvermispora (strain B) TaxID=914234 RepID=M2PA27_CERS8|nr:hypothetical protein CERSUDRAFT_161695 [Gelatoporia subvermispora B]
MSAGSHQRTHNPNRLSCPQCGYECRNSSGLTQHVHSAHTLYDEHRVQSSEPLNEDHQDNDLHAEDHENRPYTERAQGTNIRRVELHPVMNGHPCTPDGTPLPSPTTAPPLHAHTASTDWSPYNNRLEFETAEFLFKRTQMSQSKVNALLDLWAASLLKYNDKPPFADHNDLHKTIDATHLGGVPWQSFETSYTGSLPDGPVPSWMTAKYEIWYRDPRAVIENLLSSPDFNGEFDVAPYREYYGPGSGERQFTNVMSGDWAWKQANLLSKNKDLHGSMFVPVILGSDKTTVSVATGQNEYYPLYLSIGNIHNNVRRAHRDGLVVIGFLAIAKSERRHADSLLFRRFRRQLFHSSLASILASLRPGMTSPVVLRCPDGHFRRAIFGLGPYIADYPEQALAALIVQGWCFTCPQDRNHLDHPDLPMPARRAREHTEELIGALEADVLWHDYGIISDVIPFTSNFPRADIHELLAGDLLHQIIKGCFKDHLVTWVGEYLVPVHGEARGQELLDEIDRRIAAVPPFPGLRRFPQGRDFKQWTGDDSKALMKVYLPAIAGLVPDDMVRTIAAFLEFCYLVRRSTHTEKTLQQLEDTLQQFHEYREVFRETGVRPAGFSLPRQHSMQHYIQHIRNFGAPNGLCSSITEARHITTVKEPWRRSNRYDALGQVLKTNLRLDKLAAARVDFTARGMLRRSCLSDALIETEEDRNGVVPGPRVEASVTLARRVRIYPKSLEALGMHIGVPQLERLVSLFLYKQLNPEFPPPETHLLPSPSTGRSLRIFHSAIATFYAPSDLSGVGGMHRERIRATPHWRGSTQGRFDCAFINKDPDATGFTGMDVARVRCFFSFKHEQRAYPCALVEWFSVVGDTPDDTTGMWIVEPDFDISGHRIAQVVHVDMIVRGAHLIGVAGDRSLPFGLHYTHSLDAFNAFYMNKYADHHVHEIAF